MALTFDKDEVLIYEVRRHWFVVSSQLMFPLMFAFLPLFVYSFVSITPLRFVSDGNTVLMGLFFYALWVLIAWIWGIIIWTDYYLDLMILTSKRLVRVEQRGLFSREVSYLDLRNIEDVKSEMHGVVATMFNYGDLSVQSAASAREFVMTSIADPFEVRDKLNQALVFYEKKQPDTFAIDERPE